MDDGQLGWPRVIQYLDFEVMGERLGRPVAPLTVRLDPDRALRIRARQWAPVVPMGAERHLGYALQWFGLALALVVIVLVLLLRSRGVR
jgi:surfeit locus 1 family protein